jgi:hypothetical protein
MPLHPSMLVTFGSITTTQTQLLRQTFRVLLIAFVLIVITAALPLNLSSQVWGHQFSSAILNVTVLPWLAIALGRLGVTLQQREQLQARVAAGNAKQPEATIQEWEDGEEDDDEDENPRRQGLARDGDLRFLAKLGFYAMVLLAVWQVVLFGGSLRQIDARQVSENQVIDQRFGALQQQLKGLSPENLNQAFQQLGLEPGTADQPDDPFERLQQSRDRVRQQANRTADQARFALTRESFRNFLLAVLYGTGFFGLSRF